MKQTYKHHFVSQATIDDKPLIQRLENTIE